MRASSFHCPFLAPEAPSTNDVPKFDSHTTRTRLTNKTSHHAWLSAPSAANFSRLSLLCIPGSGWLVPRQRRKKTACWPHGMVMVMLMVMVMMTNQNDNSKAAID